MQLAQVNIAKMKAPLDDPIMQDFVDNLDRINLLAEANAGFIWRLKDDENATTIRIYGDDMLIVNMSVWEDIDALSHYVYQSAHVEIFKRKKEWFSKMSNMHMALWYIDDDVFPTVDDAENRLNFLQDHGETPFAFSFRNKFDVEDLKNFDPTNLT